MTLPGSPRAMALAALLVAANPGPPAVASPLPLALTDVATGAEVSIDAAGVRALHVVYLATWCEPCLEDLDVLSDLEARWGPEEYRLILVAVPTRQDLPRLREFAQRRKVPGRLLWDRSGDILRALEVADLPAHRIFDPDGRVVYRGSSARGGASEALDELMRRSPAGGAGT